MPHETDYEVGYKKPPKNSQFKKGQSGNPRGRPRGAKNSATLFNEAFDEKVSANENGRRRKITRRKAMFKQLAHRSAQGDLKATQTAMRYMSDLERRSQAERALAPNSKRQPQVVVVLPDNGRDPELTRRLKATRDKYLAEMRQGWELQGPANENEEAEPDNCDSAA
jgi:hypothetical protein